MAAAMTIVPGTATPDGAAMGHICSIAM